MDTAQASCCPSTSRGGWGGYGMGNVRYFRDQNRLTIGECGHRIRFELLTTGGLLNPIQLVWVGNGRTA